MDKVRSRISPLTPDPEQRRGEQSDIPEQGQSLIAYDCKVSWEGGGHHPRSKIPCQEGLPRSSPVLDDHETMNAVIRYAVEQLMRRVRIALASVVLDENNWLKRNHLHRCFFST